MPITVDMNILVCIKQVTTTPGGTTFAMNRFDEYALEAAIQIKEQLQDQGGRGIVDVVTVGRKKAEEVIKRALGMGADNGFHIVVENDHTADVTAQLIHGNLGSPPAQTIESSPSQASDTPQAPLAGGRAYDLVLTGMISQDQMEGMTGPILAELMGMTCATGVIKISLDSGNAGITVERELDRGARESLAMRLPALLTVQAGINTPRYPTLSRLLKAGSKEITTVIVPQDKIFGQGQTVVGLQEPTKSRAGTRLDGSVEDKAEALFAILRKRGVI